jgi:hypothetical protein
MFCDLKVNVSCQVFRHIVLIFQVAWYYFRYSKGGDEAPKLFTGRTNQQPNLETPGEVGCSSCQRSKTKIAKQKL